MYSKHGIQAASDRKFKTHQIDDSEQTSFPQDGQPFMKLTVTMREAFLQEETGRQ
jgi:hypothetical protein